MYLKEGSLSFSSTVLSLSILLPGGSGRSSYRQEWVHIRASKVGSKCWTAEGHLVLSPIRIQLTKREHRHSSIPNCCNFSVEARFMRQGERQGISTEHSSRRQDLSADGPPLAWITIHTLFAFTKASLPLACLALEPNLMLCTSQWPNGIVQNVVTCIRLPVPECYSCVFCVCMSLCSLYLIDCKNGWQMFA